MKSKIERLKSIEFFATLPRPALQEAGSHIKEISLKAGEHLFREGTPGEEIFFIVDGSITLSVKGQMLVTRGPGEWVGELALLANSPRGSLAVADKDTELFVLKRETFQKMLRHNPAATEAAFRIMATKVRDYSAEQIDRLQSVLEASKVLNSTFDLDELLRLILDLALRNVKASRGTIYLIDREKKELWSRVLRGKELVEIRLPIGTGIAGTVAQTGETINLEDAGKDPRFFSQIDTKSGFKTRSMLCVPMRNRTSEIIGVFQIINKQRGVFDDKDELFLKVFSDHAAVAIENARLHQTELDQQRTEKEIEIAGAIQRGLFPREVPVTGNYDVDAAALPCRTVGGDYYDFLRIDESSTAFVIADVAGKGIPSALLVFTLNASLHSYFEMNLPLLEVISRLNHIVFRNTPAERYITFFIGILNHKKNEFTYVNAGHNPPVMLGKTRTELTATGVPLGILENVTHKTATIPFPSDHILVLYTDGVSEAMAGAEEEYTLERIEKIVTKNAAKKAKIIKERLLADIRDFVGETPQYDDLTFLIIRRP